MLCYRVRKKLIPFVEGALDARQTEAVEKHLKNCSRCTAELEAIKVAYSALQEARTPAAEPTYDLWEKIEQKIYAAAEQKRAYSMSGIWRYAGATAAAAVLLAGIITVITPNKINVPTAPTSKNIIQEKSQAAGTKPALNMGRVEIGHKPAAKPSLKKLPAKKKTILAQTAKKPTVDGKLNLAAKSSLDIAKPTGKDTAPAAPPTVSLDAGSPSLSASGVSGVPKVTNMTTERDTSPADAHPRLGMSAGKLAAENGRDWIECGTPSQTNVDILNNTDTQSRIAAIFRYP